jgi:Ferritin-like domain
VIPPRRGSESATRGELRALSAPPCATTTRGALLARGGLVALAPGGLLLGRAAAPGAAAGGADLATIRILAAGEGIAIAFYERAAAAGVLPPAAEMQARSALANERDHDAALREAAGAGEVGRTRATLRAGAGLLDDADTAMRSAIALESALLAAYLGAAASLRSPDLRGLAAAIGANEAQHLAALRSIAAGWPVAGAPLPAAPGMARARAELASLAAGGRFP